MPSWNIHMAETARLLETSGAQALGVRDPNLFLFGNLVPDIYVGYMVPDVDRKLPYRETHFAGAGAIPCPRDDEFWDRYVVAADRRGEDPGDLVLGVWAHLAADNMWNSRVRRFIAARGIPAGERTRVRKQTDFDTFGHLLPVPAAPHASEALYRAAESFPQYPVDRATVDKALAAAEKIARDNVPAAPARLSYTLLDQKFFDDVYRDVLAHTESRLAERARVLARRR